MIEILKLIGMCCCVAGMFHSRLTVVARCGYMCLAIWLVPSCSAEAEPACEPAGTWLIESSEFEGTCEPGSGVTELVFTEGGDGYHAQLRVDSDRLFDCVETIKQCGGNVLCGLEFTHESGKTGSVWLDYDLTFGADTVEGTADVRITGDHPDLPNCVSTAVLKGGRK